VYAQACGSWTVAGRFESCDKIGSNQNLRRQERCWRTGNWLMHLILGKAFVNTGGMGSCESSWYEPEFAETGTHAARLENVE
jgi:hypothetical protein